MSNPGPFGDEPFGDLSAMFEQLARSLGGFGAAGHNWDHARQLAATVANQGVPEPNVDPLERMDLEQFARIAELHVGEATGLSLGVGHAGVRIAPVNRTQWCATTVGAYQPLFERLAESIGGSMRGQLDQLDDADLAEMAAGLPQGTGIDPAALFRAVRELMGPMLAVTMAGSTVGQLGSRAFGSYDLPIPRPAGSDIELIVANISAFGDDWSLPGDDLRLWICLHEVAHHAVLSVDHVAARLNGLLSEHAASFSADMSAIDEQFGDLDLGDPSSIERLGELMGDPDVVFGAMRSERQRELLPHLDAVVMAVEGYVDWLLDEVGGRLIGSYRMVTEAVRRRRVTADKASRFVEALFGLELTQDKLDRGAAFIDGIVSRGGPAAAAALWTDADHLPTPTEIGAPGLWLARVGLDSGDLPEADLGDLDIPDYPDLDP